MTQPQPAPGWYPDPNGAPGQRYFDGTEWTSHTQQAPPAHVPQPVAVLPKKTNHGLHLLLSILTFWFFGGWIWVWIFVAISNHNKTQTIYR
ncbi:hypothetical protein SEA_PHRANNY_35 [Mycobacterium phage Phranny]|nr:hypothetical protein SEA_PHRANNY_35 [Mycobacterium phage Phranny]AXH44661.1 hypothetical protein SEA_PHISHRPHRIENDS_33 [Mycobacterium phage PhishRPhriends]AXH44811.1 membrane protein [Mycobacterium phage Reba]AZV00523.1 hypothetical protein SEA_ACFISHHOOK_34 [Mycobacterium phage ACFishhook]